MYNTAALYRITPYNIELYRIMPSFTSMCTVISKSQKTKLHTVQSKPKYDIDMYVCVHTYI